MLNKNYINHPWELKVKEIIGEVVGNSLSVNVKLYDIWMGDVQLI